MSCWLLYCPSPIVPLYLTHNHADAESTRDIYWSVLCTYWTWCTHAHYSFIDCFLSHSTGLGLNTWRCVQYQSLCHEWQPEARGLRCSLLLHARGKHSECPTDSVSGWRRHQLEDVHRCHCECTYKCKGRYKTHRKGSWDIYFHSYLSI